MEEKILSTLDKITRLAQQNAGFDAELRKRLNIASAPSVMKEDERIAEIYEYCIEKIIRKQAEEFYKNFPLPALVQDLVDDFCRMESFRRKDNFGDFCLALYQQIECMTNKICEDPTLAEITSKMWGCPAYVKEEKDGTIDISNRVSGHYSIANLIFPGQNKKTGNYNYIEKSQSTLQAQYASDKMRILVYFLGYRGMMKSSNYDSYVEFTSLLSDIYQCRNMNHRGNTPNEWEVKVFERVCPLKSFYYFKFMGGLAQYVEYIKNGLKYIPSLKEYSDSIVKQKVPTPQIKVVGLIDVKDDGRKRFR